MTYSKKLSDGRWQRKRLQIFQRDGFRCQDCGSQDDLQVHHLYYLTGIQPWEHPDDLLTTLCGNCHQKRQPTEQAVHSYVARRLSRVSHEHMLDLAWRLLESHLAQGGDHA